MRMGLCVLTISYSLEVTTGQPTGWPYYISELDRKMTLGEKLELAQLLSDGYLEFANVRDYRGKKLGKYSHCTLVRLYEQ